MTETVEITSTQDFWNERLTHTFVLLGAPDVEVPYSRVVGKVFAADQVVIELTRRSDRTEWRVEKATVIGPLRLKGGGRSDRVTHDQSWSTWSGNEERAVAENVPEWLRPTVLAAAAQANNHMPYAKA